MIKSFFYLLGLYFFRHIPQAIFWGLYSLYPLGKSRVVQIIFATVYATISYGVSLFIWVSVLTFLLNVLIAYDFQSTILPILLTQGIVNIWPSGNYRSGYYRLLLSPLITQKKLALPIMLILRILEFGALILVGIGSVDILNDVLSHDNPDLFDILFPLGGAMFFYGGITLLSLVAFFLYFIFPSRSIQMWNRRLQVSQNFSSGLRNWIIFPSLLQPYFFLTANGRYLTRKNAISTKALTLLLEKALLDHKDQVPENWLEDK